MRDKHKWIIPYHNFKLTNTLCWTYFLYQHICIWGTITKIVCLQKMKNDQMKTEWLVATNIHAMQKHHHKFIFLTFFSITGAFLLFMSSVLLPLIPVSCDKFCSPSSCQLLFSLAYLDRQAQASSGINDYVQCLTNNIFHKEKAWIIWYLLDYNPLPWYQWHSLKSLQL